MSETRTVVCGELRAIQDKPRSFTARVVNYGVVDSYGTSWAQGVFARSLAEGLPPVVWCHDWTDPIGRVTGYREDETGLDIDVEFDDFEAVPRARQAHSQLGSGTMGQFSFAFERRSERPDPVNQGATQITDADVEEFSVVLRGSVPGTKVLSLRSASVTRSAAADILLQFQSGKLDLTDALAALKTRSMPKPPAPQFEIRAIGGNGDGQAAMAALQKLDGAVQEAAAAFEGDELVQAREFFWRAADACSELLYLLGMVSGQYRSVEPGEVRTATLAPERTPETPEEPTAPETPDESPEDPDEDEMLLRLDLLSNG